MLNVVKVRIYPNTKQINIIHKTFGSCRLVHNLLLDAKIKAFECGDKLSSFDLIKRLVPMKKVVGGEFLKEVDSTALQQSVKNIDVSYKNFFRGAGFPSFKSKHNSRQSYKSTTSKIKEDRLYLPKVGLVKMKGFRKFNGKIISCTVSFEAGQYHASLTFDDKIELSKPSHNNKSIGIDVGVTLFATLSNGKMIKPLDLKKEIMDMKKAQISLSRKIKGSKNRQKAKLELAKIHLKIINKKKNFLHQISNRITNENQVIVIENLKIKNMSKKAKGSVENPNMRASAKSGLNRSIAQQSWGMFFTMLEYKAIRKGGGVIKIDPKYTSQKCSECGHISKENRQTQSKFTCLKCGFSINADINASINIVRAGYALKAS
jgi:putative transposase